MIRSTLVGVALLVTVQSLTAQQQIIQGTISAAGGCPPAGYPRDVDGDGTPDKQAQPQLDNDADGDGTNDSWTVTLTVKKGGKVYTATDECDNKLCAPCFPDSNGAGCGEDFFEPRIKLGGAKPGEKLGKCHYTYGRNSWKVCFKDTDGDCVPDKFTKSSWDSFDGGSTDEESDCFSDTAGETTSYVGEIQKGKVTLAKTKKDPPGRRFGTPTFTIVDAVIENFGTEFSGIILDGQLLPVPDGPFEGIEAREQVVSESSIEHTLDDDGTPANPGGAISASGTVRNLDNITHIYQFSFFGVNAQVLTDQGSLTTVLGPGESMTYQLDGVVESLGPAALVAYAYADTGNGEDNNLCATVFLRAADIPTVSEWGLIIMALLGLTAGTIVIGRQRRPAAA